MICMMTTRLQERSLVSWTMSKLCRQTKFSDVYMTYVELLDIRDPGTSEEQESAVLIVT